MTDEHIIDLERRVDPMPPDEYIEYVEEYGMPMGNCPDCGRPIFEQELRERVNE